MMQLSIKGQREDVPVDVSIREHTILFKLVANQESQEVGLWVGQGEGSGGSGEGEGGGVGSQSGGGVAG